MDVTLTTSPSTASSQTRLTVTAAVWLATRAPRPAPAAPNESRRRRRHRQPVAISAGPDKGNVLGGQPGDGDHQVDRARHDGEHGAEPGVDEDLGRQEPTAAWCDEQGAGDRLVAELAGDAEDAEQERGAGDDRVRARGRAG